MKEMHNVEEYDDSQIIETLSELGMDTDIGMKYCGDLGFYKEILEISVSASKEKIAAVKEKFEEKDYQSYTIIVHSVKSSAANIGAMTLSGMARALEKAGKEGDYHYIEQHNEEFVRCYEQTMLGIEQIFDIDIRSISYTGDKNISSDKWDDMLSQMAYHLSELEFDIVEELADEMLSCKISEEAHKLVLGIKEQLHLFHVEGVKEKLNSLSDMDALL